MKRLLLSPLILPLLLGLSSPVQANIDPKVREACLPAADFLGCVKAYTTKPTDMPSMRIFEGGVELSGNRCPEGMAYVGGGTCREVQCIMKARPWAIRDIALSAAGWPKCPWAVSYEYEASAKAVLDPSCPMKEPYLFTRSSCDPRAQLPSIQKIKRVVNKNNLGYWNQRLEEVFGVKNLATDSL